jgi:AMMECR1 domain-containing protein
MRLLLSDKLRLLYGPGDKNSLPIGWIHLSRGIAMGLLNLSLMALSPSFSMAETLTPQQLVKQTLRLYYSESPASGDPYQRLIDNTTLSHRYPQSRGVFVTLSRNGKPRACWGSAYPQYKTIAEATVYATLGALTKEYRYRPIHKNEWPLLKTQVTVIKALEPIDRLSALNPLRDGLLVRQGGKAGVMLPGEATDATYQLVQCKLKAGIGPHEKFQMYRMIADVYP